MDEDSTTRHISISKRIVLEWIGIGAVIGLLYITGLHTEVLGTVQRAMLWTGFFDAEKTEINTSGGPYLSEPDYHFTITSSDGEDSTLKDFKGNVIFINVWASWCPPCIAEMPTIEKLYTEVSPEKDVSFLIISLDEDKAKAKNFMMRKTFTLPFYFPASKLPEVFQSQSIPATYIVSKEGQIVYKKEGLADYSAPEFRDWLLDLSDKPGI